MPRIRLHRSIGFRSAVALIAVFFVGTAIGGATAYSFINTELARRHERILRDESEFFSSIYRRGGIAELTSMVEAHATASRNRTNIYLLEGPDGRRVAGNVPAALGKLDSARIAANRLGIPDDFSYFVRQGRLGDNLLTLGSSAEDITEIDEIILGGFAWASGVLLLVALAGGIAVSLSMQRRVDAICATLTRAADGDFNTRVPVRANGDDIDMLAEMTNATVAKLGASIESIRQISNDISHDLKTPVSHLRILIETARKKQLRGGAVLDELDEAMAETGRIIATFDALLRIAQIESGARRARFAELEPAALLADVAELYHTLAEDSGIHLELQAGESRGRILGDRDLLSQLFANLFENAIRHCPTGTVIRASMAPGPGSVEITIADNGPGIPEGEREKALRRLYRLEHSRTTPGSGLGLSMVKAIADLHEARLVLGDNNPGLKVTLIFPRRDRARRKG